ncbi:MAG TPA: pectinesterase family protein [Micromonosporaceae bacterium]|nr:pectinesterase family protein [Micromonosporaceae bacterium]
MRGRAWALVVTCMGLVGGGLGTGPAGASAASGPSVTVALDGSGDFTTIQTAVDAVPSNNASVFTIRVKPGVYAGRVEGDVDFIFGRATAVFDRTRIHSLSRGSTTNNGYVTAPSTAVTNRYGFLFTRSRFTATPRPGRWLWAGPGTRATTPMRSARSPSGTPSWERTSERRRRGRTSAAGRGGRPGSTSTATVGRARRWGRSVRG